jgi:hypothetical protein
MANNYLTRDDVENYGGELLDVSQRAAMQAVAPYLQQLQHENADLRVRQAREHRRALDERVASLVPDYRTIDANPAWHQWLLGTDLMSGRMRQQLLNESIRAGDERRVKSIFDGFRNGAPAGGTHASAGRRSAPLGSTIYDNESIRKLYDQHRRGEITGDRWDRIEADIFAAQREGRVRAAPYLTK